MLDKTEIDVTALREDLAAMFRLAVSHDWHEGVANHFSAATNDDGTQFLINPRWVHFSHVTASNLLHCDANDTSVMARDDAPDPSAWGIHSAIHRKNANARVVLHLHPPYATALAALKDPTIKPIDQVTARYYNRVAYDLDFGGIAHGDEEGDRIAEALGDKSVMMMGNHGVTTVGQTVAEAFDAMYHLERAARTLVLAYSTGQEISVMSDNLAESTAQDWEVYKGAEFAHFAEKKRMLDKTEPDYRH